MPYMVMFRSVEGKPGYHQADELDQAVEFVERLRNAEGVEHARIFRMEEVTFEFQPYFRVTLRDTAAEPFGARADETPEAPAEAAGSEAPTGTGVLAEETAPFEPMDADPEPVGGNGTGARRGLFGR